jgi:hypothetical protein
MTIRKQLLTEIEAFLKLSGMNPTAFGKASCGDPHIVRRLRAGFDCTTGRVDKIRRYMSAVGNGRARKRANQSSVAA